MCSCCCDCECGAMIVCDDDACPSCMGSRIAGMTPHMNCKRDVDPGYDCLRSATSATDFDHLQRLQLQLDVLARHHVHE